MTEKKYDIFVIYGEHKYQLSIAEPGYLTEAESNELLNELRGIQDGKFELADGTIISFPLLTGVHFRAEVRKELDDPEETLA